MPDADSAWQELAEEIPVDSFGGYTADELGLHEMIDEIVFRRLYFARARTLEEFSAYRDERRNYVYDEASGHERERLLFEFEIESVLLNAYSNLPADLSDGGSLGKAHDVWMKNCLEEAGFPEVIHDPETGKDFLIYQAEGEQLKHYDSSTGYALDDFFDLRLDCARKAANYPTLEPDVRDEMIERVRRHYLQAVYDYLNLPDVAAIPIQHHEGTVYPLEMSFIQRCLEVEPSDRAGCAEHYRVELSEAQMVAPVPEREIEDETAPYPLVGQPCGFDDAPGLVIVDREGGYCDMFENLEFIINYPETDESKAHVSNLFAGGRRLLNCPNDWLIDAEGKCRYPRPQEAALREAWLKEHPDEESPYQMTLYTSLYPDKN